MYFFGTFCVKIRGVHLFVLEGALIKDIMNTFQKSQDYI